MNCIKTKEKPACIVCNEIGKLLYINQKDKLFGTPGKWNLKKCTKAQCGSIWLDPMPIESDIGKAYQTYYTHTEANEVSSSLLGRAYRYIKQCYLASRFGYDQNIPNFSFFHRILGQLMYMHPCRRADLDFSIMYMPQKNDGLLLEIGCGSGSMLQIMQGLGWKVEGVEVDTKAVEIARSKGLNVNDGDLSSQKYPDDHFDAITMSHVIEHVHDPFCLLQECHRILKPNGMISIVTPNALSFGHKIYKSSWLHLDPPRHLHIFSPFALESLVTKTSLKIKYNSTTLRDANNLFIASRSIRKNATYVMGSPAGLLLKIWARGMQIVEWLLLKITPAKGEEIVMIATK